jgi:hypothetical protein
MIGQLLPNTNEMLQCILAIQILDLNTAIVCCQVVDDDGVHGLIGSGLLHEGRVVCIS